MTNKIMLQLVGQSACGPISGTLIFPDAPVAAAPPPPEQEGEPGANTPPPLVELEANAPPVELAQAGECVLQLDVAGFGILKQPLRVDLESNAGAVVFNGPKLNGLRLVRTRVKDAMSKVQSGWLYKIDCQFGYPRELVLVAGADTSHKGTDFYLFADTRRIDQMYKRYATHDDLADDNTIVTQFHFETGERFTYMLCDKSQESELKPNDRWMVVDHQDYGRSEVEKQSPFGLSITDVYKWITAAGVAQPGRVVELSFFAHGFSGGPVLVNTEDQTKGDLRDPNDHDGREKDFHDLNMDVAAFRRAFRKDVSFCFNAGCNFDPRGLKIAEVVIQRRPRRPDKLFRVEEDRLTWDECRDEMQEELEENYSAALANAIDRPVWGAGPGNGARVFSEQTGGRTRHYHKITTWHTITRAAMKEFQLKKNRFWYLRYLPVASVPAP